MQTMALAQPLQRQIIQQRGRQAARLDHRDCLSVRAGHWQVVSPFAIAQSSPKASGTSRHNTSVAAVARAIDAPFVLVRGHTQSATCAISAQRRGHVPNQ